MDIRDLNTVQIKKEPGTRFQGTVAPEIDKTFLKTASAGIEARRKQEEENRKEQLDFLKTMVDNEAENAVIEANAELAQIDGLNAMEKSIQLRQKLQKKFEQRKQKIPEQFVPHVEGIFQKKLTRYNKFAIPYTLGQAKRVHDEANKTYLANSINEAIEDSGDYEVFNRDALAKVTYAAAKAAQKRFGDEPELVKEAISKSVSETIRRSVEQQAFLGRFDKASELLEDFDDELLPADRVKALKLIQNARSEIGDKQAITLASMAMAESDGDPEKGLAYIRASASNDKEARAAEYFFRAEVTAKKQSERRQIESTIAKINQAVARGEDTRQLILQLPPGEERDKVIDRLNENRSKEKILTDFSAVDRLTSILSNAVTARDLPDDLIESYRHLISAKDMRPLEEWYFRLKQTDNREAQRVNRLNDSLVEDTFNAWATQNKIVKKSERATLRLAVQEEVERMLTINPRITPRELKARILNTLRERGIKEEVEKRWFLFDKKTTKVNPNLAPDDSPTPHASWVQAIRAARPNYTESQINAAIQELIKMNVDVTRPRN